MRKGRYLLKDKNCSATILDAIIAIGIAVAFFIVFIYYTNALYTIQDEPGMDLEVKSVGLMETLINSPGQTNFLYPDWQEEVGIEILKLGLGTSNTIQYGTLEIIYDENKTSILDGPYSESNSIGIDNTCFLAGTQIVMSDESYKNIEDINVGDFVKSYDTKSQRIEDKQVTQIFHHTPEEMGDYYLVINNQLRVTPNHRFYVEGDWIFADELKIGDSLFYPSTDYTVFSIEKIFERTYTYNFEVEGHHNYFVAMESTDILVHNDDLEFSIRTIPDPPQGSAPYTITFFCEVLNVNSTFDYEWDFGDGETKRELLVTENPHSIDYIYNEPGIYDVKITITYIGGSGEKYIYGILVLPTGEIDSKPWVLTGKEIYPDFDSESFQSYSTGYYVKYTELLEAEPRDIRIFELKEKTNTEQPVIDRQKIGNITSNDNNNYNYYESVKSALGLMSNQIDYNFCIEITIYNEDGTVDNESCFGASYENCLAKASTSMQVLVYFPPTAKFDEDDTGLYKDLIIDKHPFYKQAEVTISLFIGGTPPPIL